jgi:hypothetical protein
MDIKDFENFRDWIPVRAFWREDQALVDWCYLGRERLIEPFFDDSIMKRFRQPFNLLFQHQTEIEFLGKLNEVFPGIKPTGFIFHLSRCGSTLVSQMLAALPQNIVISEASPVDFVIRSKSIAEEQRINWLRWMVNALGQKRNHAEENYFIKFDSWNTLELNLIKRAFPDVPWIFLYREPVEVIVSHIRQRGAHMIPGLIKEILPELSFEKSLQMPPEEYCARVLGRICQSALDTLRNGEGLAVNYTELPEAVGRILRSHFKVGLSENDLETMFGTTKFNAKNPNLNFVADTEEKKKQASPEALRAAERFVNQYFEELENIRKNTQKTFV